MSLRQNPLVEALKEDLSATGPTPIPTDDLLRGVLAGCGDCIKILDLDGRLQFMSEGGKRVMEVDDFTKLKGCPWPEFWQGQGNADAAAAVKSAIAGQTYRFQGPANTAKGTPRYWDVQVSPIFDASGNPSHLLSISKDITEEWKAAERERFLKEELQHRMKNMLATVIAIARQTFKDDAQGSRAFVARLAALDRTHDLLSDFNSRNASVRKIVEGALESHIMADHAVRLEGPEIVLGPKQALALALATNELATNAIKYGSLKEPGGQVDIRWAETAIDNRDIFQWTWRESGGPSVMAPTQPGFGTRVIKNLLAEELNGTSELRYEPAGLICKVSAPSDTLTAS